MSHVRRFPPTRPLRLHPLAACLASALFLQAGSAVAAAAPHGNLVVQNCDDAGAGSLRDIVTAAADGDTIDLGALECGAITLTSGAIALPPAVGTLTVNGPGAAALEISGNDASRVFEQASPGTLTLSGMTLAHGLAPDHGGCVDATADVALNDVAIVGCIAGSATVADASGGGVFAANAVLSATTFANNAVDGNQRVRGGAIAVTGTLSDSGSTFTGNHATSHDPGGGAISSAIAEGGAISALGATDLTDSIISGNGAASDTAEAFGGGLAVGSHADDTYATLDILRGTITGNTADSQCGVCAPQGGGIAAVGITRVRNTTIGGNASGSLGLYGGAGGLRVFDAASVEIDASVIADNHADSAGGGMIAAEYGSLTIDGTTISGNDNAGGTDEGGGGVLCLACALTLTSSTVSGNTAIASGGGIMINYGYLAPGPAVVINSTISGNSGYEGGGLMLDGNAQIESSTIAFNDASFRGAGISATYYSYQIDLQSTIVSNNSTGDDANNVWAFPGSVSGANNLVPNAPGLPADLPPDTIVDDPLIQPLGANGGPTMTHALGEGSPAIDRGNDVAGLVFDQRGDGFMREVGDSADIGAFEVQGAPPPSYTIGGTVSGLVGHGLVLQQNGGDDLAIDANGGFTFAMPVQDGTGYVVSVSVQPGDPAQTCVVAHGEGSVAGADVSDVEVTCSTDIDDRIFENGFDAN